MQALQMDAPRKLSLLDGVPEPAPREGEVLVRCQHVSICGSNIHPYLGLGLWAKLPYPKPPGWDGHECIGTIVDSRLDGWAPGTRVLAHPQDYAGFAELIRAKPPGLVALPQGGDPVPLIAAQPLATVLRAMCRIGPVANLRCAIVGQGPMGLCFTAILRRAGARQVIGVDLLDTRLDAAKRFGATDVVNATNEDPTGAVRELTDGAMADLTIEAVGFPETLASAVRLTRRFGKICVFGVPRYEAPEFPLNAFFRAEMEMICSVGADCVHFFDTAVRMLVDGFLDLSPLITHRLPWREAPRAFDLYANHADGVLKVAIQL